jgi:hypothetical protein
MITRYGIFFAFGGDFYQACRGCPGLLPLLTTSLENIYFPGEKIAAYDGIVTTMFSIIESKFLINGGSRLRLFMRTIRGLILPLLIIAGAHGAFAQGSSAPTAKTTGGIDWNEAFEGSTDSSGQVMSLTSSATYHFSEHFNLGAGVPIYFDHLTTTTGATSNAGLGDIFVTLGALWKNPVVNYGTSLTGSAPTGDSAKGFSTGHAGFDWNNRLDHDFAFLTPFIDAGVGDTLRDTLFFHRPFTSFGYLGHFEGGTDVDLTHSFSLTLSAYDIAPWGTQTIFSRAVAAGAAGAGGQHGRVFETNHQTTGGASINQDDGFTAGLNFNPNPYLNFDVGYTRSVKFAFNAFSWGIGVNVSKLLSSRNSIQ